MRFAISLGCPGLSILPAGNTRCLPPALAPLAQLLPSGGSSSGPEGLAQGQSRTRPGLGVPSLSLAGPSSWAQLPAAACPSTSRRLWGSRGVPVGTLLPAGYKLPPLHNCSRPLQSCCPVSGNICPPRVSHLLGVYREATMVRAQASLLETAPTVSMGAFQLQAGLQMGVGACVTPRPFSFLLLQVPSASFLSYVLSYLHFSY